MLRAPRLAAALAAAALCLAPAAPVRAQDLDLDALERTFEAVARDATPRTVLVKAIVDAQRMGAGSGAIISPDGFILTCTHVIEVGKTIEVVLSDGTTHQAKVLGRNVRQDYALLKVEAKGLPFFRLGDSTKVAQGDWVMALGHPGGPYPDVKPAFAAGRVRALERKLPVGFMQKYYNRAIMTDCPIYAGDSGGPLVNLAGELIGINGAIVMINEMAFAVPLEQILADLERLKAGETIEGEQAGPEAFRDMQSIVSPEDYQKMMSRAFKNLPKLFGGGESPFGGEGPDLSKLFGEGSPFGELFGGGQGGEGPDLQKMMEQLFGGGERPERPRRGQRPDARPQPAPRAAGGAVLGARAAEGQPGLHGVLVDDVAPEGPAARGGVRKGDVIVSVGGQPTKDMDALRRVLGARAPGDRVEVVVDRAEAVDGVFVQRRHTLTVALGGR